VTSNEFEQKFKVPDSKLTVSWVSQTRKAYPIVVVRSVE